MKKNTRSGGRSSAVRPYPHRLPPPSSPGEVLNEEWLKPMGMSQSALARKLGVDVQVVNGIVQGRRAVTARTAMLLAGVLHTTPQFWMNLQNAVDLWAAQRMHWPAARLASRLARSARFFASRSAARASATRGSSVHVA